VPCFHPIKAFRSTLKGSGGKALITFNPLKAINSHVPMTVPCGKCIGCRLDRSKQWAARCMHEAQFHQHNSFITLTYADEHLPADNNVSVRTFQLFMKRLRKQSGAKLRFFGVGEYGDLSDKAHYHALIFGYDFPDKKLHSRNRGNPLYTSELLEAVWPYGHAPIAALTYQTAAYVARYSMKKIGGDLAADHYTRPHPLTGQLGRRTPEFAVQSRRPGIGSAWFDAYKDDAFPSDFIVVDRKRHSVPAFYTRKLSEEEQQPIKRRRKAQSVKKRADNSPARLAVREEVQLAKSQMLKRII